MLQSFGILDGDKIRPEGSKYASYYIDMVKALPQQVSAELEKIKDKYIEGY